MKKFIALALVLTLALTIGIKTVDVSATDIPQTKYGKAIQIQDVDGNYTCTMVSGLSANFDGVLTKTYWGECTNTLLEDEGRSGFPVTTSLTKTNEDTYDVGVTIISGSYSFERERVYAFDYSFVYTVTI